MIDPNIVDIFNDPVWEVLARCSRPQYGYQFVEPIVVVRKAGIRVVVRLSRDRPRDNPARPIDLPCSTSRGSGVRRPRSSG